MVEALAQYIVDGQLGGVRNIKYSSGDYLAAILFVRDAQADMPMVPEIITRVEACCAIAAAVEKATDAETCMKLMSGVFEGMLQPKVRAHSLMAIDFRDCCCWVVLVIIMVGIMKVQTHVI